MSCFIAFLLQGLDPTSAQVPSPRYFYGQVAKRGGFSSGALTWQSRRSQLCLWNSSFKNSRVLHINYRVWEQAKLSEVLVATINLSVHYEASILIFYSLITSKHERQPNKNRLNIFHISAVSLCPPRSCSASLGHSLGFSKSLGAPGVRTLSLVLSSASSEVCIPFKFQMALHTAPKFRSLHQGLWSNADLAGREPSYSSFQALEFFLPFWAVVLYEMQSAFEKASFINKKYSFRFWQVTFQKKAQCVLM